MIGSLWIFATFIAASAQTARNAMQKNLIAEVGTIGATHVRFLYGFPFALIFFALVLVSGAKMPSHLTNTFYFWGLIGAISQILATALMLFSMKERSFVVTTALIKTEPVLVAIFGIIFLKDYLTEIGYLAILIATLGVVFVSWKKGAEVSLKSIYSGLIAAACFGLSAVFFRGGIRSLDGDFYANATTMLVYSLFLQTVILTIYLVLTDKPAFIKLLKAWRVSLLAGFFGALGSQFWFIAFSLQSAAKVRTLALIEILMAQAVSGTLFKTKTNKLEALGLVLIVVGVALLLLKG